MYPAILVGTDGSPTAARAVRRAALLAEALKATLHIATVVDREPGGARGEATPLPTHPLSPEVANPRSKQAAGRSDQLELPEDVNAETHIEVGEPSTKLVELAKEVGAELIVLGSRGMRGFGHSLLGTVPNKVSHACQCDLLIVATDADRPALHSKVVLATDGSPTSIDAVDTGLRWAKQLGASPRLVYVGHPKTAEIVFDEVCGAVGSIDSESLQGEPAEAICAYAESGGYDLIVVGDKGMDRGRLALGSVPNQVSHRSAVDVLIVKTTRRTVEELEPGQGAVLTSAGEKVAVYRSEDGTVKRLSPRCTHMGCTVGWNPAERTWDCQCHGSRFEAEGRVIMGPATRDLALAQPGKGGV